MTGLIDLNKGKILVLHPAPTYIELEAKLIVMQDEQYRLTKENVDLRERLALQSLMLKQSLRNQS